VDCGCKRSILRELLERGCRVTVVPYNHDLSALECDGILLSNGPGDPAVCTATIAQVAELLARPHSVPIAGICLGCQILALAAGGATYKLPFGHRGQNQPVREEGTQSCRITSQNHGYAVQAEGLPPGWEVWFTNLNDGTVEGIRHTSRPFFAVQFHPEAAPGPTDSRDFFDMFLQAVRHE
jgi:carbamoyl-phosphate synthase small subunit